MKASISMSHQSRLDLILGIITHIGAKSYLEIGCDWDVVFREIPLDHKVGVDPQHGGTLRMTSDEFFETNTDTFDVIFIDGLHICQQVLKDIFNSLAVLNPGGVIVMHDCLPVTEQQQEEEWKAGPWLGSVWKAFFSYNDLHKYDMAVVTIDYGCGLIMNRPATQPYLLDNPEYWPIATYQDFLNNYSKLRLLPFDTNIYAWVAGTL